jgi:hypothetical protein
VRSLRFLLAVIFVAGQLGGAVHNLLVLHVTCLEHGEVIHSTAAPEAASPLGGVALRAERAHEHDVCLVALHRRDQAQQAAPQAVVAPAQPEVREAAPPITAAEARDPLFRLAPKTSPPV